MGMLLPWRPLLASLASLGVHFGLGFWVTLAAGHVAPPAPPPAADSWSGGAVEVDSIGPDPQSGALPVEESSGTSAPGEPTEASSPPAPANTATVTEPEPPRERPNRIQNSAPPNQAALTERGESKPEKRAPSAVEAALAAGEATFRGAQGIDKEGSTAAAASAAPASFGAEGLPPGVRHLPKAFARALPQAGWRDNGWLELPLGRVGELVVELVVDEQGKLAELVYVDPKASQRQPAALRRMVERCVMMLRSGTFSLAPSARESGAQRLRIEAELSQTEAAPEAWSFEPPAAGRPGRGVFVLASGLRMEARISLMR
jgi:hypothetical protein